MSFYEKKISAKVRLIHAEQMSIFNFVILRKKQWAQMMTKQLKQDILTKPIIVQTSRNNLVKCTKQLLLKILSSRYLQVNTTFFLTNIFHFLKMYNEKVAGRYEDQEKFNWRVILKYDLFGSKLC